MNKQKWTQILLFAAAGLLLTTPTPAEATSFDWSGWNAILKARVKPVTLDGVRLQGFDYAGLVKARSDFDRLVSELAKFDPAGLRGKKDKLAFWINVYNVGAVKHVLDHPGIKSLNDIGKSKGAVWKMPAIRVGGKAYSLDAVENQIIRKLGEPRIHFAIVCASVSCPDILAEAYVPGRLDAQLASQTRMFLSNTKKGAAFDPAGRRLSVTKLFEWFAADFGGAGKIKEFIGAYLPKGAPAGWQDFTLTYLDYNWNLNKL